MPARRRRPQSLPLRPTLAATLTPLALFTVTLLRVCHTPLGKLLESAAPPALGWSSWDFLELGTLSGRTCQASSRHLATLERVGDPSFRANLGPHKANVDTSLALCLVKESERKSIL